MTDEPTYDALFEEHEGRADLDCGCALERGTVEGAYDAITLTYCPRHRAALTLTDELAAYVLDGEDCPERCECGSASGTHESRDENDSDTLTLFVRRARAMRLTPPSYLDGLPSFNRLVDALGGDGAQR